MLYEEEPHPFPFPSGLTPDVRVSDYAATPLTRVLGL